MRVFYQSNHCTTTVMQSKKEREKKRLQRLLTAAEDLSPLCCLDVSHFHSFFCFFLQVRSHALILWVTPYDSVCFLFVLTCFLDHWILSGVNHLGPAVFQALTHLDSLMPLLFEPDSGRCYTTIFISYSPIRLNHILGHIHYLLILMLAFVKAYFRSSDILLFSVKVFASSVFSIPTSSCFALPCPLHILSQSHVTHWDQCLFHPLTSLSLPFHLLLWIFLFW